MTNSCRCIALKLPNGVRNISKKFNNSNNIILSAEDKLAVSGIRQEIIVWDMDTGCLVKRLIAHFQVSFFCSDFKSHHFLLPRGSSRSSPW